jgi:WD40 repeat protein
MGHTEKVHSVAFFPDGRRIVSAADDRTICIWDTGSRDSFDANNTAVEAESSAYQNHSRHALLNVSALIPKTPSSHFF